MNKRRLPTQQTLMLLLKYEPETGRLFWKERPRALFKSDADWKRLNSRCAGAEAFTTVMPKGHLHGRIFDRLYLAHRVIWKLVTGEEPDEIDHINGVCSDNRFSNLRNVAHLDNHRNMKRPKHNTSGIVGVNWDQSRHMWIAQIMVQYRSLYLGRFRFKKDAVAARKAAEREHGFHENHGRG